MWMQHKLQTLLHILSRYRTKVSTNATWTRFANARSSTAGAALPQYPRDRRVSLIVQVLTEECGENSAGTA